MNFKTHAELKAAHPMCEISLRVCGNFGDRIAQAKNERDAVIEYENPRVWGHNEIAQKLLASGKKPEAAAIIVEATDWDGNTFYSRGWINDKYQWGHDPMALWYKRKD